MQHVMEEERMRGIIAQTHYAIHDERSFLQTSQVETITQPFQNLELTFILNKMKLRYETIYDPVSRNTSSVPYRGESPPCDFR